MCFSIFDFIPFVRILQNPSVNYINIRVYEILGDGKISITIIVIRLIFRG